MSKLHQVIKSKTHYALVGNNKLPIDEPQKRILFNGRWREIQINDVGDPFVQAPGVTACFTIFKSALHPLIFKKGKYE